MKKSISKFSSMILALALIISALSVPGILGTAATAAEGSGVFDFDDSADLAQSYAYSKDYLPKVSQDGDKNVLEMDSAGGKVFARLPFKLEAGKKYEYSISYRVVSQGDFADSKTTVLKLISSGEKDDINSLAASKRNLSTVLSWKALNVSEQYVTESGSFDATDSNVTGDYKYLTVHYETYKNFPQKIYIDKISIYENITDVTGSYEFDFNNPSECAQSYAYSKDYHPKVSQDGDKNVLEMDSAGGKVFARLPFKLEAGKKYEYSISYRVVSQGDFADSKTTVLKLISSGEKDDINSLAASKRNLSTVLSWKALNVSEQYVTESGSFDATDSNVTGDYKYLTVHYETYKNFPQKIYIDKISIYESVNDVTGSYKFDFNNPSELQASFSYETDCMPQLIDDNGKKVISIKSHDQKEGQIQLPFILEANKTYYYSINYRVVSQTDSPITLLALYSAEKKDKLGIKNQPIASGTALSKPYSWKPLKTNKDYDTVSETFTTDSTNVTDNSKYLTLVYKSDREQTIYIDSITVEMCENVISFDAGDVKVNPIENLRAGMVVALPLPEKAEYYFDGWYTDASYTNGVGLTYTVTDEKEVTLYGKWVEKTNVEAPTIPEIISHTQDSVTLKATAGYEYSMDGSVWQISPEFTGLFTGVEYKFYQRVAETKTAKASPASASAGYKITAYGDANADGSINGVDLVIIRKVLLGVTVEHNADGVNANGDNITDIRDLVHVEKIISAQNSINVAKAINNVAIAEFSLNNRIESETGKAIENAFTAAVIGNESFAENSDKTIEIKVDDTLENDTYKIYVENGNMYITAKSEEVLLKAVKELSDRISSYPSDKLLNLSEGYTFSGSYPEIKKLPLHLTMHP